LTALEASLARITSALEALDGAFALVGGLAVSVRSEPRLTRDADLVVAADDDAQAEAMIRRLADQGFRSGMVVEHEHTGRLATVRLEHPVDGGLVTDLLFASSGIENEIVASAERLALVGELVLPVATVGHLIALKLLARDDRQRPVDADDLRSLREVATELDWSQADQAVGLIEARGYHRGRDLTAALTRLREHGAY
jgi:predicted nucleotidyltransferase